MHGKDFGIRGKIRGGGIKEGKVLGREGREVGWKVFFCNGEGGYMID